MTKRFILISFVLFVYTFQVFGQELSIDVAINTPTLKVADEKVFETLKTTITEFYNTTRWTEDTFEPEERIEGTLQINVKEDLSTNSFVADFYVSTSRPIYNSNYYSQTLKLRDNDVTFFYEQFGPLFNNSNGFSDNLSAILTFYAFIILGTDYDTFEPLGGEKYFQIAQSIVNSIPSNVTGADRAWNAVGSKRNRYWLIENILNPRVKPYRQAIYDYHRRSLDEMHKDTERSRAVMLSAITSIGEVNRTFPNSMILKLFSDTKRQEIVEVFTPGSQGEKDKVYNIMSAIDPALASEFNSLRRGK
jgi:hypothetical protein